MNDIIIEDKVFKKDDFTLKKLEYGTYEKCRFIDCIFSNADLSNYNFLECEFENCDLNMILIKNTTFNDVNFKNSKLLGLNFYNCNQLFLSVNFENSKLDFTSFYNMNLKKTIFKNCNLHEVDFSETNLTKSIFNNCNLNRAIFSNTNLTGSDLRTSYNYSIDPEANRIKKAKFSLEGISGLLNMYDIVIE